jgi:predicted enzyme related to lactoylglutathione lyase
VALPIEIIRIERVLISVASLSDSVSKWRTAGFAIEELEHSSECGFACARFFAGTVAFDLCEVVDRPKPNALNQVLHSGLTGGGIVGWTWGARSIPEGHWTSAIMIPAIGGGVSHALPLPGTIPGAFTAVVETNLEAEPYAKTLNAQHQANSNGVVDLDHVVVMVNALEEAIRAYESLGVQCKRIREAGRGMRQAFFKLEQAVLEVVGPTPGEPRCWGLAFKCANLDSTVTLIREAGMQVTQPKTAIQGGRIARIVDPLDGVAIALMETAGPEEESPS